MNNKTLHRLLLISRGSIKHSINKLLTQISPNHLDIDRDLTTFLIESLHGGYCDDKSLQKITVSLPQELKEEDALHEKAMEKSKISLFAELRGEAPSLESDSVSELRAEIDRHETVVKNLTLSFINECHEVINHRHKAIENLKVHILELEKETVGLASTWMPPELEKGERPLLPKSSKTTEFGLVRQLNPVTTPSGVLRKIYRKFFKRFVIIRRLTQWVWRHGYPIYANNKARLSLKQKTKWRSLVSLTEYSKKTGLVKHKLANAEIVKTPPPIVFPVANQSYLESPHEQYEFPEVSVVILANVTIDGGSNLVLVHGHAICHDLFDPVRDYTSEELHGRAIIDPGSMRIRCLSHDNEPVKLQKAATFVDACASNYAHWLTEVLPRVALFCADERYEKVPIVVNAGLHQNILSSLFDVVGFEREIIQLSVGRSLAVSELYITSVVGYVPFERRTKIITDHSHGKFSPHAFSMLTNCISGLSIVSEGVQWPEKIFIRRNSGARKVVNESQIEKLLVEEGYAIVEPEKLTFSQQVQMFSNAKSVVGSSGAALANMIFMPRNVRIIILIGKYPDTSYWYWQNMACASGNVVRYCLGETEKGNDEGIHSDFHIRLNDLSEMLC